MSHRGTRGHDRVSAIANGWRSPSSVGFVPGVVLLAAAQFVDVLSTVAALTLVPGLYEVNPFAVAAMDALGTVGGLAFLGGFIVLCSALLIEASAIQTYRYTRSERWAGAVRAVGYGSISAAYLLAAFHNVHLIVDHFSIEWLLTSLL